MGKKHSPEAIERHREASLRQFKNGMPEETKAKLRGPRPHTAGENNHNWGGYRAGYHGIHSWLKRTFGKADRCEAKPCTQKSERYEWALIKGKEYVRNRKNFVRMCVGCHKKYDMNDVLRAKISNTLKSKSV